MLQQEWRRIGSSYNQWMSDFPFQESDSNINSCLTLVNFMSQKEFYTELLNLEVLHLFISQILFEPHVGNQPSVRH